MDVNRERLWKYLTVVQVGDNVSISLGPAVDVHVGLRCRKAVFCKRIRMEFDRHGISVIADADERFLGPAQLSTEPVLAGALSKIDSFIGPFQNQPLTPRMVEEVLGITKQERSRWSKDGRLRRSGTANFKRGQAIQIYTHSADVIAALADDPSIIASWRSQDERSNG
jgi:hypothetical protein